MFHIHLWGKWSAPYEITNFLMPFNRIEVYQKRTCKTCGLMETHFLRLGKLAKEETEPEAQENKA